MARRREGKRVLGPYRHRGRWRICLVDERGKKTFTNYETEAQARQVVRSLTRELRSEAELTVGEMIERYEKHLEEKGNKQRAIKTTVARLRSFFGGDQDRLARRLSEGQC